MPLPAGERSGSTGEDNLVGKVSLPPRLRWPWDCVAATSHGLQLGPLARGWKALSYTSLFQLKKRGKFGEGDNLKRLLRPRSRPTRFASPRSRAR